jgi:hypothetical protein
VEPHSERVAVERDLGPVHGPHRALQRPLVDAVEAAELQPQRGADVLRPDPRLLRLQPVPARHPAEPLVQLRAESRCQRRVPRRRRDPAAELPRRARAAADQPRADAEHRGQGPVGPRHQPGGGSQGETAHAHLLPALVRLRAGAEDR